MARRYRKIDPRIWNDEKFRSFSREEKLIVLYVLTAQSNRIGLFKFSPALAAEDLGMPQQTFLKGFNRVCKALGWQFDEGARVLLIRKWFRYNQPDNPNVLKSCLEDLHDLPQTSLLEEFRSCVEYLPQTLRETFLKGLPKRSPKRSPERYPQRSPNKEQEQEQEQEQENTLFCSEPQSDSKPKPPEPAACGGDVALLEFPCVGKEKSWKLTRAKLQQLQEAFPDLDALAECRKAKGWVEANPQRRKTSRGMMRFLFGWLSRAQDSGKGKPYVQQTGRVRDDLERRIFVFQENAPAESPPEDVPPGGS